MSELKATRIKMVYNGEIYDDFGTVPCTKLYYRKDEADAVIARLKESAKNLILDNYLQDKGIRHHKYKRCLAMAKWCDAERDIFNLTPKVTKVEFFARWHKRWLKLAEELKEAK